MTHLNWLSNTPTAAIPSVQPSCPSFNLRYRNPARSIIGGVDMRFAALAATAALLTGCAGSPTNIRSAYVSPALYHGFSCDQIDTEIMAVDGKASDLYHRISHRSHTDNLKMGVGLLVAWPALLFLSGGSGPDAVEYSQLKGQKDALIEARRTCASRTLTGTASGETPGTMHYGIVTLVPAATRSGYCIVAPNDYVGTGAANKPAVTSGMPRCSTLPPVQ